MSTDTKYLVPTTAHPLAAFSDRVKAYAEDSRAASTRKAYTSDWQDFETWCTQHAVASMPAAPEAVAAYLVSLADAGKSVSTVSRRAAAIRYAHKLAGQPNPTAHPLVDVAVSGIRRTLGTAARGKSPIVTEDLRKMVNSLPDTVKGKRDRALLLLGFAGAFRRSELVGLSVEDLQESRDGITVLLRRSKTDQEGEGRKVGIPYGQHPETCPVRALQAWREVAGISEGLLFRAVNKSGKVGGKGLSPIDVARAVKSAAAAAGLNPAFFSGHSLRAGLATAAAAAGVAERVIMATTGHKSERMLRRYIREGNIFRENAAAAVGL